MKKHFFLVFMAIILLLYWSLSLQGSLLSVKPALLTPQQLNPYSIYGYVINFNGTYIGPNASVILINERTNSNLTTITGIDSDFVFDLQSLPNGYLDGDYLRLEAHYLSQVGIKYVSVDTSQSGLYVEIYLAPYSLPSYVIWGYIYFENSTLVEQRVNVTLTNQRTNQSIIVTSNPFGRYKADISAMPVGYENLDIFSITATYLTWNGSTIAIINLGNTILETKADIYLIQYLSKNLSTGSHLNSREEPVIFFYLPFTELLVLTLFYAGVGVYKRIFRNRRE